LDIPEIRKPIVTEHQFEVKCCPGCLKKVMYQDDILAKAPIQYGPNAKAAVSYLNMHNLIPENRVSQIMGDLFGMPMSVATVENTSKVCVNNIEKVVEQIEEHLKIVQVKGADESGIRVAGKLLWLHTLCNDKYVHYRVSEKRGDIKKDLKGIVVHDGFASYYKLENIQHALCNAHHLRELKAVEKIDKEPWARNMSRLLRFGNFFSQQKRPKITVKWLVKYRKLFDQIINEGIYFHEQLGVFKKPKRGRIGRRPGHNLLLRLQKRADDTLRFLSNSEVPFTNNQAELSLRMIKVKQKISGCFRTFEGAKNFLTVRSYTTTAQKHGFKALDVLTNVFKQTQLSHL
jgi:transposase